jgi:hypothetical protein
VLGTQLCELPGQVRRLEPGGRTQIGHRRWPGREHSQDLDPGGMRQRLEQLRFSGRDPFRGSSQSEHRRSYLGKHVLESDYPLAQ